MHRAPPTPPRTRFDFFRYHGLWAPGVRLFRWVPFWVKSALISLAFALPLAALGWSFFAEVNTQLRVSRIELDGTAYVRAVMPVLEGAWALRDASVVGAPRDAALAAEASGWAGLELAQAARGGTLGTTEAWKALTPLREAARRPTDDVGAALEDGGRYVAALRALLAAAVDGSGLALDPEVDTYYLMTASVVELPRMLDHVAEAGAYGAAALRPGSALTASRIEVLLTMAETRRADVAAAVARAEAAGAPRPASMAASTKAFDAFRQSTTVQFLSDPPTGDPAALAGAARAVRDSLRTDQQALIDTLDAAIDARIASTQRKRLWMAVLVGVTLFAAGYLFRAFFLVMDGGLREVATHIDAMAGGDLSNAPQPWGRDEAATLMSTLSSMQTSLRDIVTRVRASADAIVGASSEIATGAQDLSGRTEQTAARLEQSAAAMEQISTTVRGAADGAHRGAGIAAENAAVARDGGSVIDEVVRTMQQIEQSSAKIATIISVIDGIAFQTNILALNAAVEAARAGDQGRGFAVVASEVRALSHRSAEAAREIKSLIDTTVSQVGHGAAIVRSAGETMRRIVDGAVELEALSGSIADAARQQDAGVAQIGEAIQDLDRGAQQNAALVEQTAAAAGQLRDQAIALSEAVSIFRLGDDAARRR